MKKKLIQKRDIHQEKGQIRRRYIYGVKTNLDREYMGNRDKLKKYTQNQYIYKEIYIAKVWTYVEEI